MRSCLRPKSYFRAIRTMGALLLLFTAPGFGAGLGDPCRNAFLSLLLKKNIPMQLTAWILEDLTTRAEAALGGISPSDAQVQALVRCVNEQPSPAWDWISMAQAELNGAFTGSEQIRLMEQGVLHLFSESEKEIFKGLAHAQERASDPKLPPPLTDHSPLSPSQRAQLAAAADELQNTKLSSAYKENGFPAVPTKESVEQAQANAESQLKAQGVVFTRYLPPEAISRIRGAFFLARTWAYVRTSAPAHDTTFLEITQAPPSKERRVSPNMPALLHPGFSQSLQYLHDNNYRLLIDPSLSLQEGALAYQRPLHKSISMSPGDTWTTFVHEVEHARNAVEFWKNGGIEKLVELSKTTSPSELAAIKNSNPRLQNAIRLARMGFNQLAIDETLAYTAEEQELVKGGFRRGGRARLSCEMGRLVYQILSLDEIPLAQRSREQSKLLARLRRNHQRVSMLLSKLGET